MRWFGTGVPDGLCAGMDGVPGWPLRWSWAGETGQPSMRRCVACGWLCPGGVADDHATDAGRPANSGCRPGDETGHELARSALGVVIRAAYLDPLAPTETL